MSTVLTNEFADPMQVPALLPKHRSEMLNPQEVVLQAGLAYINSACLNVAVKLGIPDRIHRGSKDVRTLALESHANEDFLFRILRVLEMNQIVVRVGSGRFELTAAGTLLCRGTDGSMAACIEWIADPLHLSLYSGLRGSVESGETTFDRVYGEPFFKWLSKPENRDEASVFNHAMTSISEMCIPAFLEAYDFSGFSQIVDVGGGHGALLKAILRKHPDLKGTVAEMPAVVGTTREGIAAGGLAHRCKAVCCNFFESVPPGGDCYLMKHIVHDWADRPASRLLRNIRNVLPAQGKLILAEAVLDESPAGHPGKLLDIEMMTFVGGKERTRDEFRALLSASGFSLQRVIQTRSPLALLEAIPV